VEEEISIKEQNKEKANKEVEEVEKARVAQEDTPGKKDPENICLGNFYSEETRDVVCQMQLPAVASDSEKFHVATIVLTYQNVMTNTYEKVTTNCFIGRSHNAPVQSRDFDLDKQINRLIAAHAMEEARQIGPENLQQARKIISDAISHIKSSLSVGDSLCADLLNDLEDILRDMKDSSSYEKKAKKKMAWKGDAHGKQRAVGGAGGGYQTSAKSCMQIKAAGYVTAAQNFELDSDE